MARLRCKSCKKTFELNGTTDIFCPNCNHKLENSYHEWIKTHEDKTFDDYKKRHCHKSHSNSCKIIYDPTIKSRRRRNSNKIYVFSILIAISFCAIIGNPDITSHKKALHKKIFQRAEFEYASPKELTGEEELNISGNSFHHQIENSISVSDYLLFSVTNITWAGKTTPIGYGLFGYVYISDYVRKTTNLSHY